MSLALVGLAAILILTSINVFTNMMSEKLGTLRDPMEIWEALNTGGLLPIRLKAWIFSTIVGYAIPYSRTINFRITELRKGRAYGVMKETRRISNPFRCVHAAALITFGETVGTLALYTLFGKHDRAILTNISAEYVKISRGLLTASSIVPPIKDRAATEAVTYVLIKNASFETVSKLTLTWKLDLKDTE
ncbi:unnamed protein product [Mortierella alpina]